eukprot:1181418-Prorocentrum_minimum.AAC.2
MITRANFPSLISRPLVSSHTLASPFAPHSLKRARIHQGGDRHGSALASSVAGVRRAQEGAAEGPRREGDTKRGAAVEGYLPSGPIARAARQGGEPREQATRLDPLWTPSGPPRQRGEHRERAKRLDPLWTPSGRPRQRGGHREQATLRCASAGTHLGSPGGKRFVRALLTARLALGLALVHLCVDGALDVQQVVRHLVHVRLLLHLVYHSAHGISNIPLNIRRLFPAARPPLAGRQSTPGLARTKRARNTQRGAQTNSRERIETFGNGNNPSRGFVVHVANKGLVNEIYQNFLCTRH